MSSRAFACIGVLVLLALSACRTGAGLVLDSAPAISREQVIQLAMEAAGSSAPEVGILEARPEEVTADLLDRREAERRLGTGGGWSADVSHVWWVEIRGYYRYEGVRIPGGKPPVYEADRRIFFYAAGSGRPLGGRIPGFHLTGPGPTPTPAFPPTKPALSARIALVRAGDIYILDTATGTETRLTDDGRNRAPRWASDGRSLSFAKNPAPPTRDHASSTSVVAATWQWRPGIGSISRGDGVVAPDGEAMAVEKPLPGSDRDLAVWVERGGSSRQVTPTESGASWRALAWSADGQRLALVRLQPAATHVEQKGARVAVTGATLWLADLRQPDSALHQLSMPHSVGGQPGVPDVAWWSPDARFLTVGAGPADGCSSCRADGLLFHAVPADGGKVVELGSALWTTGAPSWAPASPFAVLSAPAGRETYRNKHLLLIDPATDVSRRLAEDPHYADVEPAVAPNGRLIAFARGWAQVNGVPQVPVAPDLHPNVATIASRRLWLVSADGSKAHQLLDEPGWTDEAPVWTADAAWLVFVRWRAPAEARPAVAELWAVRPDGSGAHRLAANIGNGDIGSGFGYYGAFNWRELFALAPN
jgi:Tol biopolymer transport system component